MPDTGSSLDDFINLHDFEAAAIQRLPLPAREYMQSGAADEITLRRNREAFDEVRLHPRVLVDVSSVDTSVEICGEKMAAPLLIAPTGYHRLFHERGELETGAAAAAADTTFIMSTMSTVAVETLARETQAKMWFQLYSQVDREQTSRLIRRAEDAGCTVIVVTVDTPVLGSRDRERRFAFPEGEQSRAVHLEELDPEGTMRHHWKPGSIYSPLLNPMLTWKSIASIRNETRLPVLLKGVMSPEDARVAVSEGIDGLIVSNHGGRNLDTAPAAIEALPAISDAVQGRIPILMDGGVRRGTDVLKALALGACAVCLGRPVLWGLAVGGAGGVQRVIETLRRELTSAMALSGVGAVERVKRSLIWND
jgi:4-hydroxymandelate oxidase